MKEPRDRETPARLLRFAEVKHRIGDLARSDRLAPGEGTQVSRAATNFGERGRVAGDRNQRLDRGPAGSGRGVDEWTRG